MPAIAFTEPALLNKKNPVATFSALGAIIPFQPSLQDTESIRKILRETTESIGVKLLNGNRAVVVNNVLERLRKLFNNLDYHSHRKGIAVLLTPEKDRVLYLNFPVKPVIYLKKEITLLELLSNSETEPDYYMVMLENDAARLYEFHHSRIQKIHEIFAEPERDLAANLPGKLVRSMLQTLELINSRFDKPVFVTGQTDLVNNFYNSASYGEIIFINPFPELPYTPDNLVRLSECISTQWNKWTLRFLAGKIRMAEKSRSLISNSDAVLKALRQSYNGLLLIHKQLMDQVSLLPDTLLQFSHYSELRLQLEKFIERGNRFLIMENRLLKNLGGIVLLKENTTAGPELRVMNRAISRFKPFLF